MVLCTEVKQFVNFSCGENSDESFETTDSETRYDNESVANAVEVINIETSESCCM